MDHIIANLWLGSQRDADNLVRDNPENITAILNVRGPDAFHPPGRDQSAEHPGKAYKWIPAPDIEVVSRQHVEEAVAWLHEQTEKNERILIHCKHGISRSPAFLAAFMVRSGISADLEQAKAMIRQYRDVEPATQMIIESGPPVPSVSAVTGLPNRSVFAENPSQPFVAILDIDHMTTFNNAYGQIAGDTLLRRLAKILISAGLDAYHDQKDEFLCKGGSREELNDMLSRARRMFQESFEIYADGRIQTIEGADFSYAIGATLDELNSILHAVKKARLQGPSPEWLRRMIETQHGSW